MAVNKVIYGGSTLIDLSQDTVTTDSLLSGVKAHAKDGTAITGNLVVQKYYTGSTTPASSFGNNGDIYLKA